MFPLNISFFANMRNANAEHSTVGKKDNHFLFFNLLEFAIEICRTNWLVIGINKFLMKKEPKKKVSTTC